MEEKRFKKAFGISLVVISLITFAGGLEWAVDFQDNPKILPYGTGMIVVAAGIFITGIGFVISSTEKN